MAKFGIRPCPRCGKTEWAYNPVPSRPGSRNVRLICDSCGHGVYTSRRNLEGVRLRPTKKQEV